MIRRHSFKETDRDWTAIVPPEHGTFFGQPLSIEVCRYRDEAGALSDSSLALVHQILESLPEVLRLGSEALERYEKGDPSVLTNLIKPLIWLGSENDDEDETLWTLVVERADWPDYGYHIEFRGTDFMEIWAGD